jgi:hypothetical protein
VLRWALYEAAQTARRKTSPDYPYYQQAAERLGDNRALLRSSDPACLAARDCFGRLDAGFARATGQSESTGSGRTGRARPVIPFPESDHRGVVVGRPLLAFEFVHQRVPVPMSGTPATDLSIPRQARCAAGECGHAPSEQKCRRAAAGR